ncbi:TetR/AcrR family transcriptional regulator [Amycolatopsis acidicola]|uniref:TetR/AcrR family transcriptional regulator n=1 Tax=Amycolatopsis acidicola TaxID=2596893 RepID=A0A5N0UZ31_9PSEU|nr:TetR/AcrR family transcriptional regulator [Amycolatopsis acidicola]KAA9158751.1 TetR/AcrR family transcriptional regulator [Amycolatopsis acidicola]
MRTEATTGTREQLLAAAERLLAEAPYDDVSVRAINTAAGMNPAAVHYHFGSKDDLVAALLEDRLAPRWQGQLDDLEARREAGWKPAVAELVDLVLAPFTELAADPLGRLHLRLLARVVLGRRRVRWTAHWFRLRPWTELLREARPELSVPEARRRWLLAFDLIMQTIGAPLAGDADVGPATTATLRTFLTAGLEAKP